MVRKVSRSKPGQLIPRKKCGTAKHHSANKEADVLVAAKKKRNVRKGNCYNCECDQTETDLWRSDIFAVKGEKRMVCNACGLWSRDHGYYRPRHMWKHIKTRLDKEAARQAAFDAASEAASAATHSRCEQQHVPRHYTQQQKQQQHHYHHHSQHHNHESTVPVLDSSASTPLENPSEPRTPFESPALPSPPLPSPAADYFSLPKRNSTADDLVAANTLLSMMSTPMGTPMSTPLHEGPPPLARATEARPSFSASRHSYSYDPTPILPSCRLFQMVGSSTYIPSWMGPMAPPVAPIPTTPTQASYGRRHSYPIWSTPASPAAASVVPPCGARTGSVTPTTRSFNHGPQSARRGSAVVRPSLANICSSAPSIASTAPSSPVSVASDRHRDRSRTWSNASSSATTSSSSSATSLPPQFSIRGLAAAYHKGTPEEDTVAAGLRRLDLY